MKDLFETIIIVLVCVASLAMMAVLIIMGLVLGVWPIWVGVVFVLMLRH